MTNIVGSDLEKLLQNKMNFLQETPSVSVVLVWFFLVFFPGSVRQNSGFNGDLYRRWCSEMISSSCTQELKGAPKNRLLLSADWPAGHETLLEGAAEALRTASISFYSLDSCPAARRSSSFHLISEHERSERGEQTEAPNESKHVKHAQQIDAATALDPL